MIPIVVLAVGLWLIDWNFRNSRSDIVPTQIVPKESVLIRSSNSEFLDMMGLDRERFALLNSSESIAYRSGKYGETEYILKILINNKTVIEYRRHLENPDDINLRPQLRRREIANLRRNSTGRVESIEYKGGGYLEIEEFRKLMQAEIDRLKLPGSLNDPEMIENLLYL